MFFFEGEVTAGEDEVGLDADAAKFSGGELGGFGFEFFAAEEVGEKSKKGEGDAMITEFVAELAGGFKVGFAFDISDSATNFDYDDVGVAGFGRLEDVVFDGVGDVWNDLDGFAEIFSLAFFFEDLGIDFAGGEGGIFI